MKGCPHQRSIIDTSEPQAGRTQRTLLFKRMVQVNNLLRKFVYRSPFAARRLFNCELRRFGNVSFWELGTLAMRKALVGSLRDGMRALEIGTGPYAILSVWAAIRWRLDLTATDVDQSWVEWARASARTNQVKLNITESDLFSCIRGAFDAVWFVPPHTPEATFEAQVKWADLIDPAEIEPLRLRSCGGKLGWEIIDRFYLGVPRHLKSGGRAFLAISLAQQRDDVIKSLIARHKQKLCAEVSLRLLPYRVYVTKSANEPP